VTRWVIAHRGASRDCPENTLAAFDEALRQGCNAIELDLQLSLDGVPVVYHDRTLTRAGGGRKRVSQLTLAELARLPAGERFDRRFRREHIPTLEEVVERYAGRTCLLLELKTREGRAGANRHIELARGAATLVRRMRAERNVMMLAFDRTLLAACAAAAPGLRQVLNMKPPPVLTRAVRSSLDGLHALSVDIRKLTPRFASELAETGTPMMTFTCNTPRTVRRALQAGAMGIMSDRPGWLAAQIALRRAQGGTVADGS
jgi:glycerophosphoryl diester phosphodiesterase